VPATDGSHGCGASPGAGCSSATRAGSRVSALSPSGTHELKNLAVGLHADVVLLTSVGGVATKTTTEQSAEGVAYRCNSFAPR